MTKEEKEKKSTDVRAMIVIEITKFAKRLATLNKKWATESWITQEYNKHIQECQELEEDDDVHLITELVDKVIIAKCYMNMPPKETTDNMVDAVETSMNELMKELERVDFEVPEYDGTIKGTIEERKKKFLAKIYLQ